MSKITLEITEVVNGVSITETPITLVGDTLSAAASTTATGVTFTPAGGIAATNVQTALAELDSEKMNASNGVATDFFTMQGTNGGNIRWQGNVNTLKVHDGSILGFGASTSLQDTDMEIFHVSNESYIRDTGAGTLFIQTDGPSITLGSTANNLALSATFVPGGAINLYHNYGKKFETTSNGIDVTGLVEFDSLSGTGAVAITDILDADDMSGASATTLSTSESIKAYVDSQVAGKDNTDEITEGSTNLYFTNARADARIQAADTGDLSEGSNLYFTNARADARIQAADTGDLSEGSNLYFTNARADARIAAATTTDLSEGSNLYFTNTRADARIANNIIDEDGFSTNSATRAPSQQSVKAYVAAQTANIQGDITNVITGNGLIGGGTSGAVTVAVDTAVVATASNTLSLNNKTLNTPAINSPDINGGTVDGATIGAATPSTGKFAGFTAQTDQGNISIPTNTSSLNFDRVGSSYLRATDAAGSFTFVTGADDFSTQRLKIANNGAVVFYEDTGATAKLTWSASTEDLNFAHNVKATFGGGDDLQIYHDGSHSYIADVGVGNLWIGGENVHIGNPDADEFYIQTVNNGAVTLFHNNSAKIATTSTGIDVTGTAKATQFKTGSSIIREDTNKTAVNWEYTGKEFSTAGQESNPGGAIFGDSGTKLYVIGTQSDRVQQYSVSSAYDLSSTVAHVGQANVAHGGNPQDLVFSEDGSKLWTLDGGSDQLRYYTVGTNWDITTLSSSAVVTRDFSDNVDTNPTGFRFNADGTKIILVGSSKAGASGTDIIYSYDLSSAYDIAGIGVSSGTIAVAPDAEVQFDTFKDSLEMSGEITLVQAIEFSVDGKTAHIACRDRGNIISFALATAFDITTMSFAGFANTANEELTPTGIYLNQAANVAIIVGLTDDNVVQYTVNNPGTVIESSGSTQVTGNLGVYKNATFEKDVYISGRLRTASSIVCQSGLTASGNVAFNTAGGTVKVGGTSSTGVFEFGRSTDNQTIKISAGATASGKTNTVNIGNAGASGSTTNINIGGGVGTCTTTIDGDLVIPNETPASATAAGTAGQIVWDTNYIYICTATNTWKRVAIGTW